VESWKEGLHGLLLWGGVLGKDSEEMEQVWTWLFAGSWHQRG
jgi:hypothetical protein